MRTLLAAEPGATLTLGGELVASVWQPEDGSPCVRRCAFTPTRSSFSGPAAGASASRGKKRGVVMSHVDDFARAVGEVTVAMHTGTADRLSDETLLAFLGSSAPTTNCQTTSGPCWPRWWPSSCCGRSTRQMSVQPPI
jgi:hypothetical protein